MAFDVRQYVKERDKKQEDGAAAPPSPSGFRGAMGSAANAVKGAAPFDVKKYIAEKQTESQNRDKSYADWMTGAQNLSRSAYGAYLGRQSIKYDGYTDWEDPTEFAGYIENYRTQANDLLQQGQGLMNDYGKAGNSENIRQIQAQMNLIRQMQESMEAEHQFRSQFAGHDEYYDFLRQVKWDDMPFRDDFAEKSQFVPTKTGEGQEVDIIRTLLGNGNTYYKNTGYGDLLYDWVNGDQEAGELLSMQQADAYSGGDAALRDVFMSVLGEQQVSQMSNLQRQTYNYIYATEGQDEALRYLDSLKGELNAKQRSYDQSVWAQYAKEHPWQTSAATVFESPLKAISATKNIVDYATGNPIDQNSSWNKLSYIPSTIRSTVSSQVEKNWGKVGTMAYSTGMSMADNIWQSIMSGAAFMAGPGMGTAVGKLAEHMTLAIMSTGATADALVAAKDRGLTDEQAMVLGIGSGIVEYATEKIGLDALLEGLGGQSIASYLTKSGASEGLEEFVGGIADWVLDMVVTKDKSEFAQSIEAYKAAGASDGEAIRNALLDKGGEIAEGTLSGFLSGIGMAGGGAIIGTATQNVQYNQMGQMFQGDRSQETIDALTERGWDFAPDTEAYRMADKLAERFYGGQKISDTMIGRAWNANIAAEEEMAAQQQRKSVVATLTSNGVEAEAAEGMADTIQAILDGEEISGKQAKAIAKDQGAVHALEQLLNTTIDTDVPIGQLRETIKALPMLASSRTEVSQQAEQTTPAEDQAIREPAAASQQATHQTETVQQAQPAAQQAQQTQQTQETAEQRNQRQVEAFASKSPASLATAMREFYSGEDAADYVEQMNKAYNAGKSGADMPSNAQLGALNGVQIRAAYNAGRLENQADSAYNDGMTAEAATNDDMEVYDNGRTGEAERGVSVRHGSERNDSQSAGGTVRAVAETAGRAESQRTGEAGGSGENEAGSGESQKAARSKGHQTVSTRQLGIVGGSKSDSVSVYDGKVDTESQKIIKWLEGKGYEVKLFAGDNIHVMQRGSEQAANGYTDSARSIVAARADDPTHKLRQILGHEKMHVRITELGLRDKMGEIRTMLEENGLSEILGIYETMYEGTGLTPNEVTEELVCDAEGGLNVMLGMRMEAEFEEKLAMAKAAMEWYIAQHNGLEQGTGQASFVRANFGSIAVAEYLEEQGNSREDIWAKTGLLRDTKGNWVTEIDDSGAKYHKDGDAQLAKDPDYAEYQGLMAKLLYGELTAEEEKQLRMFDRIFKGLNDGTVRRLKNGETVALVSILDHADLYRADPLIGGIGVKFEKMKAGENGYYNAGSNTIALSENLRDFPMSTLLHEIQHALQNRQGRPGGSNPQEWFRASQSTEDWLQEIMLRSRQKEISEEMDRISKGYGLEEFIDGLVDQELADQITEEESEQAIDSFIRDNLPSEYLELQRELYDDVIPKLKEIASRDKVLQEQAFRNYQNTAGEIEARETANRRNMTAEQRRQKMPDLGWDRAVQAEDAWNRDAVQRDYDGKYEFPRLKDAEWNLLNYRMYREIGNDSNYADEMTKWLYADSKGVKVFALYGIGDGTEPTVLFAVGGNQATMLSEDFSIEEEMTNDTVATLNGAGYKNITLNSGRARKGALLDKYGAKGRSVSTVSGRQLDKSSGGRSNSGQSGGDRSEVPGRGGVKLSRVIDRSAAEFSGLFKTTDNGHLQLTDASKLTDQEWSEIAKSFKRLGYEIHGGKDAKAIYTRYSNSPTFNADQSEAIRKIFGQNAEAQADKSNPDRAKKAAKHFGTTTDFREAGYILQDGRMLDFSGKKEGGPGGVRYMDHREISPVFDDRIGDGYSEYMNRFISEGNIRLMQDVGIDIGQIEPTAKQYSVIRSFVYDVMRDGNGFSLDISTDDGHRAASRFYEDGTSATRIINDIKGYYKNGELPEMSTVAAFHSQFSRANMSFDELRKENADLRKQMQDMRSKLRTRTEQYLHWKGETQLTDPRSVRPEDVKALAKKTINGYGSTIKVDDIAPDMKKLAEFMRQESYADNQDAFAEAKRMADDIASRIIKNVSVLVSDDAEAYSEIKKLMRQRISISAKDAAEIPDFAQWRKANWRHLNIGIDNGGLPIDTAYGEMQSIAGWLFPDDIMAPSDMLRRMEEVYYDMEPVYANPYSYRLAEATEICSNGLMEELMSDDIRAPGKTFADKQEARVQRVMKQLNEERQRRERLKERFEEHLAKDKARRESGTDSMARTKLLRIARRLNNMKLPAVNRALIQQYIGDLDLVSKSLTGKTIDKLSELRDWYDELKTDPDFVPDERTEKAIARLSKKHIADLTQQEVADLTEVLMNIENEIRTMNREIATNERRTFFALGAQTIQDIDNTRGIGYGKLAELNQKFFQETLSPVRAVHMYTGYNADDPLYKSTIALADGQRKMLDFQMRASHIVDPFMADEKWTRQLTGKDATEIEINGIGADGKIHKVKITPDMRISLYLHSKNAQNMQHITNGGITVPNMELYKKGDMARAYSSGTVIRLTPTDIRAICSKMSQREIQMAEKVSQEYFTGMSQKEINETSLLLKGYELAGVDHYFPINTDRDFARTNFDQMKADGTVEGIGALKERVNATNAIMLVDFTTVLKRSIDETSKYVGLGIPVRNINKLLGITKYSWDANNLMMPESSVVRELTKRWGKYGTDYVRKMLQDVQFPQKQSDVWGDALKKLRSNYAASVLTLNLSVAMKQAASYPTAAAIIGNKALAKALTDFGKVDLKLIEKYTPLQWYRSKGYSTQELGDMNQRTDLLGKLFSKKALNWIQGMDVITTRKLWKAAEYYIQDTSKLQAGTDAYYRAVADVYNRIIEETQPNYTTMQRPQLLRSDNQLTQSLVMFKTQPFQNFNILADAYGELFTRIQQNKANSTAATKAALQEAGKAAWRATYSQIEQLAVFAAMTALYQIVMRGRKDKYSDEDGTFNLWTIAKHMVGDMVANAVAIVPFADELYNAGTRLITGETYYGWDVGFIETVNDMYNAVADTKTILAKALNGDASLDSIRLQLDDLAKASSKVFGIPYENVENTINGVLRYALQAGGKEKGDYMYARLTKDPEKNTKLFMDMLYSAYTGKDKAFYTDMYDSLAKIFGEDKIATQMENRMKAAENVKSVSDLSHRYLTPEQQTEYDKLVRHVKKDDLWDRASDDTQQEVLDLILAQVTGKSDRDLDKIAGGEEYGLDFDEYVSLLLALNIVDKPNDKGNLGGTPTKDEAIAAVEMVPGLTQEEKEYLFSCISHAKNPYSK